MREILKHIAEEYRNILGNNLVGIYVHGSLAFGCFNYSKSDIDFIVVVNSAPAIEEKEAMIKLLLDLSPKAPGKGFEMSVVLGSVCKSFVYPTPFELHYSVMHLKGCKENLREYCTAMNGIDEDLAAHFTVIKSVGFPIIGEPIKTVFGEVPRDAYWNSIKSDIANAVEAVKESPIYVILNLCRVVAYKNEGLILSKEQGGLWGIEKLSDKYKSLISEALKGYKSEDKVIFEEELSLNFCNYMIEKILDCRYIG